MKKKWTKKRITGLCLLFFVFSLVFIYYFLIAMPVIKTYTIAQTRAITEKAVNLAVSNVVNRTLNYDSLIDIHYSSEGEISSFSANQYEINSITREIVKESQYQMNNLGEDGLKINFGTLTGVPFFIGRGPIIRLRLMPIGSVSSEFDSQFDAVGINMTRHTLFLYVYIHVNIVLPVKSYDVYTKNQVMLAESIIIGKVPQFYFNNTGLGNSLNLIPD